MCFSLADKTRNTYFGVQVDPHAAALFTRIFRYWIHGKEEIGYQIHFGDFANPHIAILYLCIAITCNLLSKRAWNRKRAWCWTSFSKSLRKSKFGALGPPSFPPDPQGFSKAFKGLQKAFKIIFKRPGKDQVWSPRTPWPPLDPPRPFKGLQRHVKWFPKGLGKTKLGALGIPGSPLEPPRPFKGLQRFLKSLQKAWERPSLEP